MSPPSSSSAVQPPHRYKPHQSYAIGYLANTCPNRDGIIVYHYMGSGKTFTGLGMVVNLGKPVVLLAPRALIPQWHADYLDKYKMNRFLRVDKVLAYEDFWDAMDRKSSEWRKQHTLLVDEAHNLSMWLSTRLPVHRRQTCLEHLFEFGKRVLLTGTPIYWGEHDLSFLVNVARGEAALPIDERAFRKTFYNVKVVRSALEGWVAPVSRGLAKWTLALGALGGVAMGASDLMQPTNKYVAALLPMLKQVSVFTSTRWYDGVRAAAKPLMSQVIAYVLGKGNTRAVDEYARDVDGKASQVKEKYSPIQKMKQTLSIQQKRKKEIDDENKTKWWLFRTNTSALEYQIKQTKHEMKGLGNNVVMRAIDKLSNRDTVQFFAKAPYWIAFIVIFYAISVVIKYFFTREADTDLLQLNYQKLVNEIAPYVSYYKPDSLDTDDSGGWMRWLSFGTRKHSSATKHTQRANVAKYPTVHKTQSSVSYDTTQTALFMRYTIGTMDEHDYTHLGILRNPKDKMTTAFDQTSPDDFRNYGRMIGNVCTFRNRRGYHANVEYNTQTQCYALKDGCRFATVAPKFRKLKHVLERGLRNGERLVVYSNFNNASMALSAYLHAKGVAHWYRRDADGDADGDAPERSDDHRSRSSSSSDDDDVKTRRRRRRHKQKSRRHRRRKRNLSKRLRFRPVRHGGGGTDRPPSIQAWQSDERYRNTAGILLLGQSYSEGTSILNANAFHLLDPCESVAKNDQTCARVARLGSHTGSKTGEVTIVEWLCTLQMVSSMFASVAQWLRFVPNVFYGDQMTNHKQCITPDAIVHREVHRLGKSSMKVMRLLRKQSIEQRAHRLAQDGCGRARGCTIAELQDVVAKADDGAKDVLGGTCAAAV